MAQLKGLVSQHGPDEVRRRIDVLFDAAPRWLDGRDVGTLVSQFDKLAAPARAGGVAPVSTGFASGEV